MSRLRQRIPLAMVLAALCVAGCKPRVAPDAGTPAVPPKSAATTAPAAAPPANSPLSGLADVGKTPALTLTTVDDKPWDLANHRGKWVVVNYWATWCGPCLEEMPELSALDAMREHIEVIGVANEEISREEMQAFLKAHPVVYPIAIADPTAPPADFGVAPALPITWLVAPHGKIAKRFMGPVTAKDIEAAIAAAGGPKVGA